MDSTTDATPDLSDHDLVLNFESVGDNCELGLVQRLAGAEPLGLLRFAGAPLRSFLRALSNRFDGIADPASIRIHEENGEYMVKLNRYDFYYHAHIKTSETTPEALHAQQSRTVGFLAQKLISDLESPSKILVFRQNEPLLAADLMDLRIALDRCGPSTLLWVQAACPGHPPGTVAVADGRLMIGYVNRLAPREDVPNLHLPSWLSVLRKAHAIWRLPEPERVAAGRRMADAMRRHQLTFGTDGNAGPHLGFGWSGPEAGYQWSVGERSLLTLPNPGPASEYWLEMDVIPYIHPPLLPRQRLDVSVNGGFVHSFDPLPRAMVCCSIPGELAVGDAPLQIRLDHPFAASPVLVAGGGDDRRLAISFSRLALTAVP
ncbi:hypothetical protein [Rhodopila sp.]|jgi:hypothetical protein|uniref:hypothetical protein n=1 Tax=Rhodopila sp. TaxID=2480087 RepID=UPI002CE60BE8|nr:hypothetical protein [Rhodopila sp.]HVZ09696.1 hypothetical protein [Rhodopila sp.]